MVTVTTASGLTMILEDAGRDADGRQLWREVEHAPPRPPLGLPSMLRTAEGDWYRLMSDASG